MWGKYRGSRGVAFVCLYKEWGGDEEGEDGRYFVVGGWRVGRRSWSFVLELG